MPDSQKLGTAAEALPGGEPLPPVVVLPMSARNPWLALLTLMAFIVFLRWAQAVFIPIVFSILLSYALTPVVNWLKRKAGLHKALGAALTLTVLVGFLCIGLTSLQREGLNIIDTVPRAMEKFSSALQADPQAPPGAVAKLQAAATEIEKAANAAGAPPAAAPTVKPIAEPPRFKIRDYVLVGTLGLATGIGQFVMVVSLVYFLLIAGDTFRRTLIRITEGTLSRKKITVQMLDEIDSQIQRYLLVQIATSALLGAIAWLIFAWIGLENAAMWGCIGGLLHLVPYAGPVVFVALVGYVQFDTLQQVVVVMITLMACNSLIGLLLVPWLTQKVGSLNAVTVFIALLAWGWLWGIWGLLLGVPIMMAIKAICDRVEDFQPISAFLGHAPAKPAIDPLPTAMRSEA